MLLLVEWWKYIIRKLHVWHKKISMWNMLQFHFLSCYPLFILIYPYCFSHCVLIVIIHIASLLLFTLVVSVIFRWSPTNASSVFWRKIYEFNFCMLSQMYLKKNHHSHICIFLLPIHIHSVYLNVRYVEYALHKKSSVSILIV